MGLTKFFRRGRWDQERARELESYLEIETDENIARGMSAGDARLAARRKIGSQTRIREDIYEMNSLRLLESVWQDLRYAVRALLRNPAYAATAGITLALAISANTVMFSVVNAVLLRPLPYRAAEALAVVFSGTPGQSGRARPSYATVEEWRHRTTSFADFAVLDPVSATLADKDGVERIGVARISANFFPLLGIQPFMGRVFSEDEAAGRQRLALVSYRFWQTRLGGARDALGASIEVDGRPLQIVGVLPANLPQFDADVWEPHTLFADWDTRRAVGGPRAWFVWGRLKSGTTFDQAQSELSAITRSLDERLPPAARNGGAVVVPLDRFVVGSQPRLALWVLTGAVLCVVLIASANVASLALARGVSRRRELATRVALGASARRLVRQLLAESLTLAVLAGLLGSCLAIAGIRLTRAFGPADLPRLNEVSLDVRVLGWTLVTSLAAGFLIGLAPVIAMLRRRATVVVDGGGRSISGGRTARLMRRALVQAQFALAIVVMAGAGLLVRSWWQIQAVDPGFRPDRVLSIQLATPATMAPGQRVNFYAAVLEQIGSVSGVESAALVGDLFVSGDAERLITTDRDGAPASERLRPSFPSAWSSARRTSASSGPDFSACARWSTASSASPRARSAVPRRACARADPGSIRSAAR